MVEIERRLAALEVRAAAGRKLEGLAAPYDRETPIADFVEVIRPGAFTRALTGSDDVLALVDHDPTRLLGRRRSGTLRLSESELGLTFIIEAPATQLGHDVVALAERGDLGGVSIGFRVPEGGEIWIGRRRELRVIDLVEVSIIQSFAAYADTNVAVRNRPAVESDRRRAVLSRWRR